LHLQSYPIFKKQKQKTHGAGKEKIDRKKERETSKRASAPKRSRNKFVPVF